VDDPGCGCGLPPGTGRADLLGTLRALTGAWRDMTAGLDADVLAAPAPAAGGSVLDHLAAARATVVAAHDQVCAGLEGGGAAPAISAPGSIAPVGVGPRPVGSQPGGATPAQTLRQAIAAFDRAVAGLNAAAQHADAGAWAVAGGVGAAVEAAVHDAVHHLHDAGRVVHARGGGARTRAGRVAQVNASAGGVPKLPVLAGHIDRHGLVGDRQAERRIHGRPHQALSLWSADVIDALRAEGHTVFPGAAGENVTLAGVDWPAIRPGVRLQVGEAIVEVSGFATPCAKNARWFAGGEIDRIDQRRHPGQSRAYAWALRPGAVRPGDAAVVEPH
jgi:MOSC domain-containing protein YiiM